jgi:D-serine dehydratase
MLMPDKGLPFPDSASPGNWNILRQDLPVPVLVLRESALAANIRAMSEWCERHGLVLCPHGKTTMCPQIFQRQMAAGAWGITVATVSQALVCAQAGFAAF